MLRLHLHKTHGDILMRKFQFLSFLNAQYLLKYFTSAFFSTRHMMFLSATEFFSQNDSLFVNNYFSLADRQTDDEF